ncbi:caspase family protein [Paludisphaera sp.]|uniref:caspase family protein n=1 Tax=Paludisphaera sp. TaxID=2017432 RepID=UPI00301BA108
MPSYAVVVGINEYRESGRFGPLTRPVGDAIRMMEWLLDPGNAHGVAEDDLILLLAPNDDDALGPILDAMALPADRREAIARRLDRLSALSNRREAEFDQINRAVREVHERAGGRGERLYFYYSGHGLSAATDALGNDVEDALVPADYDPATPKPAISIPSITRTFLATSCREQFFFLDCCRNRVDREEIARVGRLSPHRGRIPTDQYIYNATALGLTALEGEGLFSDLLLKGLEGAGSAKVYSPRSGAYEVRAERLFRYLREGFEGLAREAIVGGGDGGAQAQRPRLGGDHGGDPVLKMLAVAPAVNFRVEPETPPGVAPGAKVADVRVFGEGLPPEPPRDVLAGSPVAFSLAPRFYLVHVVPGPGLEGPPPAVREVYDDPTDHPVKLAPAPAATARSARAAAAVAAPDAPGRLVISANDPLAAIELLDSAGSPIPDAVGLGRLELGGLAPGVYRARTRPAEGPAVERLIALAPGDDVSERLGEDSAVPPLLYASGPPFQGLRLAISGEVVAPGLGGSIDEVLARRLATPEGVAAYLDALEIRVRPMDGRDDGPIRLTRAGARSRLERRLAPGPYFVTVAEPARRATTFATVVLEGRATELAIHQGADARVDVLLAMPPARGEAPEATRLVGMLQRLVRQGESRLALATGERLLKSSPFDPTAGMIVGLLRLREGRLDRLADVADRLVERFPALPDAHALLGLLRLRGGDPAGAREAFRDSLARGLPALAPLLSASAEAVAALGVAAESPRAGMLDEVADALVPGLLWSAHGPPSARSSS